MKIFKAISIFSIALFALPASAQNLSASAEYQNSIQFLLNNIQPNGAVVAAPSRANPNYFFDWVRDTSVTMKNVIKLAYDPTSSVDLQNNLKQKIDTWINWELSRQGMPTLTSLGEPRFYIDGPAVTTPWGRPQNDGPASRALAGIEIANHWITEGRFNDVHARLYAAEIPANTMIKRDLEYVAYHWSDPSYDLWEEELGMHFYTLTVQKVALLKGAKLATAMNDQGAADFYQKQATAIDQYLQQFFDVSQNLIRYAINVVNPKPKKITALDVAVVLAAIQTYDGQFYVPVAETVSTANQLMSNFQKGFRVNQLLTAPDGSALGVAVGRYPGDLYNGNGMSTQYPANPWFLATIALAEFSCDLKQSGYAAHARVKLDQTQQAQFNRVLYHANPNGALSEQFNRETGFEQGAHDLTWSYSAYISAYRACR